MSARPQLLVAATAVVGALFTLVVVGLPAVRIAFRAPALHVVIDTTAALTAGLTAYVLIGRFRRRRLLGDLFLVWALALLVVANLPLSALPRALSDVMQVATWAPLAVRFLAGGAFAAASFAPPHQIGRRPTQLATGALVVVTGALVTAILWWGPALPLGADPVGEPVWPDPDQLAAHRWLAGTQVAGGALFALAATGFTRHAEAERDELLAWVAAAAALIAVARIHYALFPSLYTEWVYSGDVLRLGSYVLLLVGAAREISASWEARARAAVLEERRRMARDMHDGLAQELSFIASQSRFLLRRADSPAAIAMVASAAQRALDDSRRAIAALTQPLDQPLDVLLREEVERVAARHGVRLDLDLQRDVLASSETREALLRVAREAVGNAARHSGSDRVRMRLHADGSIRLLVADSGVGFDPEAVAGDGTRFGLVSMRERVEALGGVLHIDSRPGAGTRVEVVVAGVPPRRATTGDAAAPPPSPDQG